MKTDAFEPSSFNGKEEAAGGSRVEGSPCSSGCDASASCLPSPGASRVEELQPNGAGHGVGTPPQKKSARAEQTASGPLLGEGSTSTGEPSCHHQQTAGEPQSAARGAAGLEQSLSNRCGVAASLDLPHLSQMQAYLCLTHPPN